MSKMNELLSRYWLAASIGTVVALGATQAILPLLQDGPTIEAQATPSPVETTSSPPPTIKYDYVPITAAPAPSPSPTATPTVAPLPTPSVTAAPAPLPAPAEVQPPPAAPAPAPPAQPAAPAPAPAPPQAPAQPTSEYAKIDAIQAKYNTYAAAGTKWVIGPIPAGCAGGDGCTETVTERRRGQPDRIVSITVTIRPGQVTDYLVIHEIAHTLGIRDECAADRFFRERTGSTMRGHYC